MHEKVICYFSKVYLGSFSNIKRFVLLPIECMEQDIYEYNTMTIHVSKNKLCKRISSCTKLIDNKYIR